MLRRTIRKLKPGVVEIHKTKFQVITEELSNTLWAYIPSIGTSGGCLTIWDERLLEMLNCLDGAYSLTIKFRNKEDNVEWILTNIYGPIEYIEKEDVWCEIAVIGRVWSLLWCVCGDLNATKESKGRQGGHISRREFRNFNNFIGSYGLIEFDLGHVAFTHRSTRGTLLYFEKY